MAKITKELDALIGSITKKYSKDNVVDCAEIFNIPRWLTPSPSLSYVLGGGIPKGRLIHIYGPESSGKTLVATILGGYVQKQGGVVAFIDAEQSFDPSFAERFGLSTEPDKFILISPDYGEQALDIVEMLITSGQVDYIIVDSVSALTPKAEYEGEMEDQQMGLQARMFGKFLRKATSKMKRNNTTVVLINQIRMKIGCISPQTLINWQ